MWISETFQVLTLWPWFIWNNLHVWSKGLQFPLYGNLVFQAPFVDWDEPIPADFHHHLCVQLVVCYCVVHFKLIHSRSVFCSCVSEPHHTVFHSRVCSIGNSLACCFLPLLFFFLLLLLLSPPLGVVLLPVFFLSSPHPFPSFPNCPPSALPLLHLTPPMLFCVVLPLVNSICPPGWPHTQYLSLLLPCQG